MQANMHITRQHKSKNITSSCTPVAEGDLANQHVLLKQNERSDNVQRRLDEQQGQVCGTM
jgi:hypothetical protein